MVLSLNIKTLSKIFNHRIIQVCIVLKRIYINKIKILEFNTKLMKNKKNHLCNTKVI